MIEFIDLFFILINLYISHNNKYMYILNNYLREIIDIYKGNAMMIIYTNNHKYVYV